MRLAAAVLGIVALLVMSCSGDGGGATPAATTPTVVPVSFSHTTLRYADKTLPVEVASSTEQTSRGLGFRDSLDAGAGMIFDMHTPRVPDFWMRGMRFPLDMVWIDDQRRVVGVTRDIPPEPGVEDAQLKRYRPPTPVLYVLELNAGQASALGIAEGTQFAFDLPVQSQ